MKLPRRQFLHLAAGAAALPAMSRIAGAQAYPSRPVRIVVGFPAGGPADISARLISQWLSDRLGQQFIVENRPGAGSNIGTEAVVRAPADGYTLLLITSTNAINTTLYDKLNFNFTRDIEPVASLLRTIYVMAVHPSVPAKTVPEFIDYAKANPGKINMASGGIGSAPHIYGELFKTMTGVDLVQVHYRGAGPALVDLLAGQVQIIFVNTAASIEYIRAGRLPDIPTVGEFVAGYEASGWQGLGAPKSTPADIVEKLNKETNAALADHKIKARLADLGSTPLVGSATDFGKLIAEETEKWGKVIRSANIKAE
jgi:tripartite-type tricarboxylate transporter receptor subunit TctC